MKVKHLLESDKQFLYGLHKDSESLDKFEHNLLTDPFFALQHISKFPNRKHELEKVIATSPFASMSYAFRIEQPFSLGEPTILQAFKNHILAFDEVFDYCTESSKGRWPELEHLLVAHDNPNPRILLAYFKRVLKYARWPEVEPVLRKFPAYWKSYRGSLSITDNDLVQKRFSRTAKNES